VLAFSFYKFFVREVIMEQDFLTVDELAQRLRVPKSWIYGQTRQTDQGAIPRLKVGKKYLRFRLEDVMDWLEKNQNEWRS
jgi:excisionase family DNA binding protein